MEGSRKSEAKYPKLLHLISKDKDLHAKMDESNNLGSSSDEKKLELRLGPPGSEDWSFKSNNTNLRDRDESVLSLGYFGGTNKAQKIICSDDQVGNLGFSHTTSYLHQFPPTDHVMAKPSSQSCCKTKVVDLKNSAEKNAYSTVSAGNTAVPGSSSQKRTAPAPVVGWPPIRSFRKNLASGNSSKHAPAPDANLAKSTSEKPMETCKKGMFVKINMDGVPIGRKVDLKAYDSYEKLSSAVDDLFRGLLAAQRDSSACGAQSKQEEEKAIAGLLDGSGEYTLVYEDNEGDKMLLGDVPWHMFVSTVKRLRVLKTSEVSRLSNYAEQEKIPTMR